MGWSNKNGAKNRSGDPGVKMLYGIMKEIQRANALNALKMKTMNGINPAEVDGIMNSNPGRVYCDQPVFCAAEDEA